VLLLPIHFYLPGGNGQKPVNAHISKSISQPSQGTRKAHKDIPYYEQNTHTAFPHVLDERKHVGCRVWPVLRRADTKIRVFVHSKLLSGGVLTRS